MATNNFYAFLISINYRFEEYLLRYLFIYEQKQATQLKKTRNERHKCKLTLLYFIFINIKSYYTGTQSATRCAPSTHKEGKEEKDTDSTQLFFYVYLKAWTGRL